MHKAVSDKEPSLPRVVVAAAAAAGGGAATAAVAAAAAVRGTEGVSGQMQSDRLAKEWKGEADLPAKLSEKEKDIARST